MPPLHIQNLNYELYKPLLLIKSTFAFQIESHNTLFHTLHVTHQLHQANTDKSIIT